MRAFRLESPAELEDLLTATLFGLLTLGIEVTPAPVGVVLLAYFAERPGLEDELARALLRHPEVRFAPTPLPDVDWVARSRESFRAFDAPPFRIVPRWEAGEVPEPRALIVEPGRAFGTGTHESTRLCLAALGDLRPPLGRVLDVGTGTGLLAVAAARLGASVVFALDRDPEAIDSARLHARLNGACLHLLRGDLAAALLPSTSFDVIVANLTAPLLEACLGPLCALRAPSGCLILSGILVEDVDALRGAFGSELTVRVRVDGEWAALLVGPR
ncbi:MAG TPA: 50S ribosomal protein L11 methyltransferase [Vicinamibacteria bacterium]|jgi:ribosomal protein L11 methyltransferase|nr:50S ribosomal protein L11 methyltransferase [Vicinamibacteria bacterium]